MTSQEQLDQLNQAIGAIENGAQEYRIGNRSLRRPDLSVLYRERAQLQQRIDQEHGSGIYVAKFDRR